MTKKLIVCGAIALLLAVFATSVSAKDFSLPEAGTLPDSNFYFLKSWKESIQTFFTFGVENKAKQYLHLAGVRLAEYRKMVEKDRLEIASKILSKYEKQLNRAIDKINEVKGKGKDVKDLDEELQQTVSKHLEVLNENLQKVPDEAKKGIENAIENSSKVLEKKEEQEEKKGEEGCIQIIIPAKNSKTGECKEFPNPCVVPEGWIRVDECSAAVGNVLNKKEKLAGPYDNFAKCLTDKGVKMYGASWCPHCVNQKNMFAESAKYMPYVECATAGGGQVPACQEAGIRAYPTWIFPDGKKNEGEMTFEKISQYSGCKLN